MARDVFGQDAIAPVHQVTTSGKTGTIATAVGKPFFVFPFEATLVDVWLYADTAPTGAKILVDINVNGNTVFTTQNNRPSIATGGKVSATGAIPDLTDVPLSSTMSFDIDQVGSSVAGADLVVAVHFIAI